eukprot:2886939-Prymnesium_polylepis.1
MACPQRWTDAKLDNSIKRIECIKVVGVERSLGRERPFTASDCLMWRQGADPATMQMFLEIQFRNLSTHA